MCVCARVLNNGWVDVDVEERWRVEAVGEDLCRLSAGGRGLVVARFLDRESDRPTEAASTLLALTFIHAFSPPPPCVSLQQQVNEGRVESCLEPFSVDIHVMYLSMYLIAATNLFRHYVISIAHFHLAN